MMKLDEIKFKPIGKISTPHKKPEGTPIQPAVSDAKGTVELLPEFVEGLKDIDGFSHLVLLFHCHRAGNYKLIVEPFMDDTPRGVFATRAPSRPNSIGVSVVKLLKVKDNKLIVEGVDMLDGTPLLDIKPHVPAMVAEDEIKTGWLKENIKRMPEVTDDGRFT
jgi:tRNA-Thr(GGU) m(6)t(6)A37 methyltransferase TsaA